MPDRFKKIGRADEIFIVRNTNVYYGIGYCDVTYWIPLSSCTSTLFLIAVVS
jgi:hypothetical protein